MSNERREARNLAEVERTTGAAAIVDIWMGGSQAWRHRLEDSEFLESADWKMALQLTDAVLRTRSNEDSEPHPVARLNLVGDGAEDVVERVARNITRALVSRTYAGNDLEGHVNAYWQNNVDLARAALSAAVVPVEVRGALQEAQLQLEYLDERWPTGTTPPVIARIRTALALLPSETSHAG